MWERRYGFPTPERDANGERLYAPLQVRRLSQIKRLMDRGHRPGKLLTLDEAALLALDETRSPALATPTRSNSTPGCTWSRTHDSEAHAAAVLPRDGQARLGALCPGHRRAPHHPHRRGLVAQRTRHLRGAPVLAASGKAVSHHPRQHGAAWQAAARAAHHAVRRGAHPGAADGGGAAGDRGCLPGAARPANADRRDRACAQIKQVDVVCLSFSTAYSPALAAQGLRDLRRALPAQTGLWAGGHGVKPIRKPIDGVCLVPEFQDLYDCLARWQSGTGSNTKG